MTIQDPANRFVALPLLVDALDVIAARPSAGGVALAICARRAQCIFGGALTTESFPRHFVLPMAVFAQRFRSR
jgi:hypothetical protein